MTPAWVTVLVVAGATIAIKAAGPVILGGRQLPPVVLNVVAMLPAALLAALVAVLTFQADGALVLDARLIGVAVAAVAIWLRAPILIVVLLAAAVTATARAFGAG
ncbi:MAG: AzlD domain-containing protein [Candidatus Limnocylindria bacterium]